MTGETSRISLAETGFEAPTNAEVDELKARRMAIIDVWVTAKYQYQLQNFDAQIDQAIVATQGEAVERHRANRVQFVREKKEELEQKLQAINSWIQREMGNVTPRMSNTETVLPWNADEKVLKSAHDPIRVDLEDLKFIADIFGKEVETLVQTIKPSPSDIEAARYRGREAQSEEREYSVVELHHNTAASFKVFLTDAMYDNDSHQEPAMFAVSDRDLATAEKRTTYAGRSLYPNRPQES